MLWRVSRSVNNRNANNLIAANGMTCSASGRLFIIEAARIVATMSCYNLVSAADLSRQPVIPSSGESRASQDLLYEV